MKPRKEQIKAIEKTADLLQQWREGAIPSELKMVGRHGQLVVMVQKPIDMVVVDLLSQMPEVGKLIQDKFQDLLKQARLVDRLDAEAASFEDARLHGFARQLAETLKQVAEEAGKERNRRIFKLIFYVTSAVVIFLSSLLTCLFYLGWLEPIREFIVKMILPK